MFPLVGGTVFPLKRNLGFKRFSLNGENLDGVRARQVCERIMETPGFWKPGLIWDIHSSSGTSVQKLTDSQRTFQNEFVAAISLDGTSIPQGQR